MKALISIILITTALTSCGKRRTSKKTVNLVNGVEVQTYDTRVFATCSRLSVNAGCTAQAVYYRLDDRSFYSPICYQRYNRCLIKLTNGRY